MGGRTVWAAAVVAFLARFPSLLWPLRPDEAGFLLVARAWQPEPDSLYGRYWVDRPPPIIWLVQATDRVGGPYAHRLVGALACALLVLAAAAAAAEVARRAGRMDPTRVQAVARWVAVATAAVVSSAQIEPIAAKGETFGIPLVLGSCWLALRGARRTSLSDAFLAGLLAMLAVSLKQSLVGGLVFGLVLLVGSTATGRTPRLAAARLAAAAAAGAAVPVILVVGWALAAGVRLEELWYATVSFRADANRVLLEQSTDGAVDRIWVLVLVFAGTGMLVVLSWYVVRLPRLVRPDPVAAAAILAMVAGDLLLVAASGSFWRPYLLALIPGVALALASILVQDLRRRRPPRASRVLVVLMVVSSAVSLAAWTVGWAVGTVVPVEVRTGEAIADAGSPGDRVLVYGGRPDIQWASGAPSPYPYLWSLPMRTLDPGLDDLEEVLTGSNPPTWFVEATYITTWSELGTVPIQGSLIRKYEFVQTACGRYRVFHLNTVDPVELDVDCSTPFRTIWGG